VFDRHSIADRKYRNLVTVKIEDMKSSRDDGVNLVIVKIL